MADRNEEGHQPASSEIGWPWSVCPFSVSSWTFRLRFLFETGRAFREDVCGNNAHKKCTKISKARSKTHGKLTGQMTYISPWNPAGMQQVSQGSPGHREWPQEAAYSPALGESGSRKKR